MKVAVFSTKPFEREFLTQENTHHQHDLVFIESRLTPETVSLAEGFPAVCAFVNDVLDETVLKHLHQHGTRLIALRSAGFNHVDLETANKLGMTVLRVPAYSPYAVAEHTVALILDLNRKIHRAYNRTRECNFALDGLLGFDLHGKTVGIVGTGKIGALVAKIMSGFGCRILAYDLQSNPDVEALPDARYVSLDELFEASHIITLHCPLTPDTLHLINDTVLDRMKPGVMLINTSRGAVIDTKAVIRALKTGKVGYLGLDVYEEEENLFFQDLSNIVITDDTFSRLLTFPNVLITGHQAFFTREALTNIASTTLGNITDFQRDCVNPETEVTTQKLQPQTVS